VKILLRTFLSCSVLFQLSCLDRESPGVSQMSSPCPSVSAETAILIATGELHLDYEIQKRTPTVNETESSWQIVFKSRCEHCEGGDPLVEISKADGSIIRTFTPK